MTSKKALLIVVWMTVIGMVSARRNVQCKLFEGEDGQGMVSVLGTDGQNWHTVCKKNFGQRTASLVCASMGYSGDGAKTSFCFNHGVGCLRLRANPGRVINCPDQATDLADCDVTEDATCKRWDALWVECKPAPATQPPPTQSQGGEMGRVQLKKGATSAEGAAVEIQGKDGEWSEICFEDFSHAAAKVVCRMFDLPTEEAECISVDGEDGTSSVDSVDCSGTERSLLDCEISWTSTSTWSGWSGGHGTGGGHGHGHHRRKRWGIFGGNLGGWGSHETTSRNRCFSGAAGVRCGSQPWPEPIGYIQEIRLIDASGGKQNDFGRVEICRAWRWGTICPAGFGVEEARVVCRMMGQPTSNVRVLEDFSNGNNRMYHENVICDGSEASLSECTSNGWGDVDDCSDAEAAAVDCRAPPAPTKAPPPTTKAPAPITTIAATTASPYSAECGFNGISFCVCDLGWEGDNCQTKTSDGSDANAPAGAVCSNHGFIECKNCRDGYFGSTCQCTNAGCGQVCIFSLTNDDCPACHHCIPDDITCMCETTGCTQPTGKCVAIDETNTSYQDLYDYLLANPGVCPFDDFLNAGKRK